MPGQISNRQTARRQIAWNIVKAVLFMTILVILLVIVSGVFKPDANVSSGGTQNAPSRGFYAEPKDTIDVIGLGDSTMTNGFSPMELWKQYGYTAFNCGVGGQIIFNTYITLSDVLAQQKPKVVILDADNFFTRSGHTDTFYSFINAGLERFFPLFEYHSRWKTPQYLIKSPVSAAATPVRGYNLNETIKPYTGNPASNKGNAILDPLTTFQLDMINNLCNRNGAKLFIVCIPQALSWNQAKHNAIVKYTSPRNIDFLDLNTKNPGFSFNWNVDTRDGGTHLNFWGAKEVSQYIGNYLHSHFSLSNHSSDPAFQVWNSDYAKYEKQINTLANKGQ